MRITIVTDAWAPQVNGVVRTLQAVSSALISSGHDVQIISPDQFRSVPCPTYPEIRLAVARFSEVAGKILSFQPEALHIATEGPLGLAARRFCLKRNIPFTTAFHTRFPDYISARVKLPSDWFWRYVVWFHAPARHVLTATHRLAEELQERGLRSTMQWTRGVDLSLFRPTAEHHPACMHLPRPIQLYVGRVAVEKNLEAFLSTKHPGTKVVVGDGPALASLRQQYPDAVFLGAQQGPVLAGIYASADVFVFPSKTDTFGLVMIESLASGVPVAGFPVPGPLDILGEDGKGIFPGWSTPVGATDKNLETAISNALLCDREACAQYGRKFSWETSVSQFLAALTPIPTHAAAADAA